MSTVNSKELFTGYHWIIQPWERVNYLSSNEINNIVENLTLITLSLLDWNILAWKNMHPTKQMTNTNHFNILHHLNVDLTAINFYLLWIICILEIILILNFDHYSEKYQLLNSVIFGQISHISAHFVHISLSICTHFYIECDVWSIEDYGK